VRSFSEILEFEKSDVTDKVLDRWGSFTRMLRTRCWTGEVQSLACYGQGAGQVRFSHSHVTDKVLDRWGSVTRMLRTRCWTVEVQSLACYGQGAGQVRFSHSHVMDTVLDRWVSVTRSSHCERYVCCLLWNRDMPQ
jgi:hypothetical protein